MLIFHFGNSAPYKTKIFIQAKSSGEAKVRGIWRLESFSALPLSHSINKVGVRGCHPRKIVENAICDLVHLVMHV